MPVPKLRSFSTCYKKASAHLVWEIPECAFWRIKCWTVHREWLLETRTPHTHIITTPELCSVKLPSGELRSNSETSIHGDSSNKCLGSHSCCLVLLLLQIELLQLDGLGDGAHCVNNMIMEANQTARKVLETLTGSTRWQWPEERTWCTITDGS